MIEEVGAFLIGAMKGPSKINAMFQSVTDRHGTGGNSSQLTEHLSMDKQR